MNRLRVYRLSLLAASLALVCLAGTPSGVHAATSLTEVFDAGAIRDGKTLVLDTGAKLGIFPGALQTETTVSWGVSLYDIPARPANFKRLGDAYRLQAADTTITPGYPRPLGVALPLGESSWIRQIWQYDIPSGVWKPLATSLSQDKKLAQAEPTSLNSWLMMLEDRQQHEGIASWYCQKSCSRRYPILHATSNDFAVGTTVRVRNLENGRSVDVKIISGWGQPAGRIIDLSGPAFAALQSSNAGLARVNVSIPKPKVLGATTSKPKPKIELIPSLSVRMTGNLAFPSISPRPYAVIDQGSGSVLAEHQADDVVPIASLTKLMTAAVFLDTKTDLRYPMTYLAADQTPYAYLHLKPGDKILIRDLFYSLLVGSANNSASTLARSTGLSPAEFIARMNAKAAAWGMTKTKFVDLHGLDPANVSTARDLATLAAHALHDYEPIRFVSVKREYTFRTMNTGVSHTLKTTDKVLGSGLLDPNLIVTGGKTGFLNESKYTYTLRTAHKTSKAQVIVVLLGSNSSAERFKDTAAITNWAFKNFTWETQVGG